jgi:hypothetical protein
MNMPEPGEFLLMSDPAMPSQYFLTTYFGVLKNTATDAAG